MKFSIVYYIHYKKIVCIFVLLKLINTSTQAANQS